MDINNIEKICGIIEMELQKEMTNKEEEAYRIDQKITDSKKLLSQLRYTIISDYVLLLQL